MNALIPDARYSFHKKLFETNTLTLTTAGVASNADTSSRASKAISSRIVEILVKEQGRFFSSETTINSRQAILHSMNIHEKLLCIVIHPLQSYLICCRKKNRL